MIKLKKNNKSNNNDFNFIFDFQINMSTLGENCKEYMKDDEPCFLNALPPEMMKNIIKVIY